MKGPSPMRDVVEAMARAIADSQNDNGNGTRTDMYFVANDRHRTAARYALRAALVAMRERMTFDAGEIDAALAALAELDAEANP